VIDVEPLIARELGRLVPEPAAVRPDWNDVVGRAGLRRSHRRRLVLAFAILGAVFVTAAAVAKTLGGFDEWLSGTPGRPASDKAQQRFEAANGRSWAAFPKTTKLRELIRTEVDGREYVLYGFRSGDSLCLQLAISELTRQQRECAPTSAIANSSLPIVVYNAIAQVSFGVVADGVSRVGVHAVDGYHTAHLGGNAYLYVGSRPNTGNRILAISALDASRRLRVIPIRSSVWPSPFAPSNREPGGPTEVEARIPHPRIGWLERGEKVGFPGYARPGKRSGYAGATSFRFLKPDPLSNIAVGLSGPPLCLISVGDAGEERARSCGGLLTRGPVNALISCNACGGFLEVRGVAADGVERVVIFFPDGGSQTVPLRHNVFAARASALPIRIVGYDARNRVVATQLWGVFRRPSVPVAAHRLHVVARASGPNGAIALLHVGPNVRGFECWRATFSTGQMRGSCVAPFSPGPQTRVDLVQPAGRDLFFVGTVGRRTERIEIRFADGDVLRLRPRASHFLLAVPRGHLTTMQQRALLAAFDDHGLRTIRQQVFFRLP
jgi:hypothetical protein